MQFNIKLEGVDKALKMFDPVKVKRAAAAALNRAVRSGKTETSALIREKWAIKKSDLDRKITFNGALMSNLSAVLTVRGEPINLLYFNARQIMGGKSIRLEKGGRISPESKLKVGKGRGYSGVTAQIQHGYKTVLPHAFMGRGRGGTPLVFIRSDKVKSTVKGKKGLLAVKIITEASMFQQKINAVKVKIQKQWQKEWNNQIKQLNSGHGWMDRD